MSALEYVGALSNDPEAVENLQFHCSMLVSQLAALSDIDLYHQSFPWRVVAAMDPASIKQVLQSMKLQWEFCVNFVDALICTDKLHTWFSFTRHQSFRDVMVKAEYPYICLSLLNFLVSTYNLMFDLDQSQLFHHHHHYNNYDCFGNWFLHSLAPASSEVRRQSFRLNTSPGIFNLILTKLVPNVELHSGRSWRMWLGLVGRTKKQSHWCHRFPLSWHSMILV